LSTKIEPDSSGLDPAIHRHRTRGVALDRHDSSGEVVSRTMDRRVKPGDDKWGVARGIT
jgi:hypothetical protein